MGGKVSVVINTFNEAEYIEQAIKSVKWADEVIVCDMYSDDKTTEIARKNGAKVILHKRVRLVELVRNFQISKATGDWVLILDPDEVIPPSLAKQLQDITKDAEDINYVEIPRKSIIFGKWMNASMWWPDYNIRFFKKGSVVWGDKIHRPPEVSGKGIKLPDNEQSAIWHNHYSNVTQYLQRMTRYTEFQAQDLVDSNYIFDWRDLIKKPLGEFMGRFFANYGYRDGLHGLVLNMLQAFSFLVVYIRVWELGKFKDEQISLNELKKVGKESGRELDYWFKFVSLPKNPVGKILHKVRNKFL